jgi:hypothetical protein
MKRNQMLIISGVVIVAILVGLIFWMQFISEEPNETKFIFQLHQLETTNKKSLNIQSELIEPLLKSSVNSKDNKLVFTSIQLTNGKKLTIPILGMNYVRYNFMGDDMYSMSDRVDDEEFYFNHNSFDSDLQNFLLFKKLDEKKGYTIEMIDGINSFVINSENHDQKKVWKNVALLREHLNKQLNKDKYTEKNNLIKIYFNFPRRITQIKEKQSDTIIELKDTLVRTKIENTIPPEIKNVSLATDKTIKWDGDINEIQVTIELGDTTLSKRVKKNSSIAFSRNDKITLVQCRNCEISLKYNLIGERRSHSITNETKNKKLHCFNLF